MTLAEILAAVEATEDAKALRRIADAANLRLVRLARKSKAGKGTRDVYREVGGHPTNADFPRAADLPEG